MMMSLGGQFRGLSRPPKRLGGSLTRHNRRANVDGNNNEAWLTAALRSSAVRH